MSKRLSLNRSHKHSGAPARYLRSRVPKAPRSGSRCEGKALGGRKKIQMMEQWVSLEPCDACEPEAHAGKSLAAFDAFHNDVLRRSIDA
jgi:hypothetical protein